jgi:hypothetical protein
MTVDPRFNETPSQFNPNPSNSAGSVLWVDDGDWEEAHLPPRPWIAPGYALRGAVTLKTSGDGSEAALPTNRGPDRGSAVSARGEGRTDGKDQLGCGESHVPCFAARL